MVVMGAALIVTGLFPNFILILSAIPNPVMGTLLLYALTSQLASGLSLISAESCVGDYGAGVTIGLPLMMGLIISFAPPQLLEAFPVLIRPIVGNGFVMGVLCVIFLEHVVFRRRKAIA
jgi:xanthine/uracil permease